MKNISYKVRIIVYLIFFFFIGFVVQYNASIAEAFGGIYLILILVDIGYWFISREKYQGTFLTKRKILYFAVLTFSLYIYGVNEEIGTSLLSAFFIFLISDYLSRRIKKKSTGDLE